MEKRSITKRSQLKKIVCACRVTTYANPYANPETPSILFGTWFAIGGHHTYFLAGRRINGDILILENVFYFSLVRPTAPIFQSKMDARCH